MVRKTARVMKSALPNGLRVLIGIVVTNAIVLLDHIADKQYRDSLVYDLMELFQPGVDALVLALLGRTTFAYGDLVMTHEGRCRLHPQLAHAVVAACQLDQERVSAGAPLREMLVEGVVSTRPTL